MPITIQKGIPIPKTSEERHAEDLKLHNLQATARYHANELHPSGEFDAKDVYHCNEAYKFTIEAIRYARKVANIVK